jgi:trehalose 6-phosphate phosphatase
VTPDHLARAIARAGEAAGRLLVCTDFDGSVAPIVRDHERAVPLSTAARALAWLSRSGAGRAIGARCGTRVAVISARDSDDIAARLPLGAEAIIIGNYGLERWSRGHVVIHPSATPWLRVVDEAEKLLAGALAAGRSPGARLERKRCGLVLHTRGVSRVGVDAEATALAAEVATRLKLALVLGKHTVELHVPVKRDKASAVRALRAGAWASAAVCAAGDDLGDVGMLREVAALGECGVAIAVADDETPAVVLEAATYRLNGPPQWASSLARLKDLLQRAAPAPKAAAALEERRGG